MSKIYVPKTHTSPDATKRNLFRIGQILQETMKERPDFIKSICEVFYCEPTISDFLNTLDKKPGAFIAVILAELVKIHPATAERWDDLPVPIEV